VTENGKFTFKVPLALNDADKTWQVTVRDAATGVTKSTKVKIGNPN